MRLKYLLYATLAFSLASCSAHKELEGEYKLGAKSTNFLTKENEFKISKVIQGKKLEKITLEESLNAKTGDILKVYSIESNGIFSVRTGQYYEIKK